MDSKQENIKIFNENDYKLEDYSSFKNDKGDIDNIYDNNISNSNNNISSFKETNSTTNPNFFKSKKKNTFINNLTNTNLSSNDKNMVSISNNYSDINSKNETYNNDITSFSNINKINQDFQNKNYQEIISSLEKENETLKQDLEKKNENEKKNTDEILSLKHKISEFNSMIELNKSKYNEEIQKFKLQISEYNTYIHLSYLFFNNISKNALSSLNFDINYYNSILISIDEFKQKLNQIENFLYETLKENSNIKIKYHKLLETNNQQNLDNEKVNSEKNSSNQNLINDSFHTSSSNFNTMIKTPENIFENNYENIQKNKISDLNLLERKESNNLQAHNPLEIYKTLEQRVNMLEQELKIHKNYNKIPHIKNFNTLNSKNEPIIKKRRSKSGIKKSINEQYSDCSQNEIPVSDKLKKNVKKKKKKKIRNVHNGSINESLSNKNQKGSRKNIHDRSNTPSQNMKNYHIGNNLKNIKQKKY